MFSLEYNVVWQEDSDRLTVPGSEDSVADAEGLWLGHDFDGQWWCVFREKLAQLLLCGGQNQDRGFESCACGLSEGMSYQRRAAERKELFRYAQMELGEALAESSGRNHDLQGEKSNGGY